MKKILLFVLMLVLIAPSSSFANESEVVPYGAGEWDLLLDGLVYASTTGTKISGITSGGGDLRVCASGVDPHNIVNVGVFKTSGTSIIGLSFVNSGSTELAYSCLPKFNVSSYVDSNGKLDIYLIVKGNNPDTIRLVVED